MKNIDFESIKKKAGGIASGPPAGAYVVRVVDADDEPDRERIMLAFDIAEGQYAGCYSDNPYYQDKLFAHSRALSYSERSLYYLCENLEKFAASNPGFDAEEAFNSGDPSVFVGKVIGIVVGERERVTRDGKVRTCLDWAYADFITADAARAGDFEPKPLREIKADENGHRTVMTADGIRNVPNSTSPI